MSAPAHSPEAIEAVLHDFILTNFLPGEDPASVRSETALLSSGVIPSLALLELVSFIEHEYRILIEPQDLGVERMDTLALLVALVRERLAEAAGVAEGR